MPTLVFVYNADAGLFNLVADAAHKLLSPSTYNCHLCAVTHGHLGPKKEWTAFVAGLGVPTRFLHRDEFRKEYGMADVPLPAVFLERDGGGLETLLDAAAVNAAASLDDLKRAITDRLAAARPA